MSVYLLDVDGEPLAESQMYKMRLPDRRELGVSWKAKGDPKWEVFAGPANTGFLVAFKDRDYWESGKSVHLYSMNPFRDQRLAVALFEDNIWLGDSRAESSDKWNNWWYGKAVGGRNYLAVADPDPDYSDVQLSIRVGEEVEPGYHRLQYGGNHYFEVEFVPVDKLMRN